MYIGNHNISNGHINAEQLQHVFGNVTDAILV